MVPSLPSPEKPSERYGDRREEGDAAGPEQHEPSEATDRDRNGHDAVPQ